MWCQTVGSPCSLPHQPAVSCASMNSKKEKHTSELSIPERKKEELHRENKWLHSLQNLRLFIFSPEASSWPLWESWESRQNSHSDFLRDLFSFFNLIFSLLCLDFKCAALITSTGDQYVSCHCNMSVDAMDSPEYRGGFCRAHCLHECRLADWQSKAFKLRGGGQQNRGISGALPANAGHLRALHQDLPHAVLQARHALWSLRWKLQWDCQWVLAGNRYFPPHGNHDSLHRGICVRLYYVCAEYYEEKHF